MTTEDFNSFFIVLGVGETHPTVASAATRAEKYAKISPEQLAGVSRLALRAYDACQAGDEQDARALFERLDRMRF